MGLVAEFLASPHDRSAFVLRGYAGTGKTTLLSALVRLLRSMHKRPVLLAPTGRAAKVFGLYSGGGAYTIHKTIYRQRTFEGENTRFELAPNKRRNTLFIVDEASMLSTYGGGSIFGSGSLLDDLIMHVYEGEGCRLMLVGDTAQLPPVGDDESPALNPSVLEEYDLETFCITLKDVVRQAESSGVLWNATRLRTLISTDAPEAAVPRFRLAPFADISAIVGGELIEELESCYSEEGTTDTIVVTRSNRQANRYNNGIRSRIFDREEPLERGDIIMVAKNNYYWTEEARKTLPEAERPPFDFIANGDLAEVVRVYRTEHLYGFTFAEVCLSFPDYDDYELDLLVLLDTLQAEAPALPRADADRLFQTILEDYAEYTRKGERIKKVRENLHYNALQIKYAYAVTCHKAQGGQWSRVFVDQAGITPEAIDTAYLRWLYTAVTRTTDRLYLVNLPESMRE